MPHRSTDIESRISRPKGCAPLALALILAAAVQLNGAAVPLGGAAVGAAQPAGRPPGEEGRLNNAAFHNGLKDRGLTELLSLHLKEFPPKNLTSALLIQREIRLAEAADGTRTAAQRRAARVQANDLLEELIGKSPGDDRRLDWLLTLAHSRLYDEAKPYFDSLLFIGGGTDDRVRLRAITRRVLELIATLRAEVDAELERIDTLDIRAFEKLERTGYVERLERIAPQADYLRLWTLLFDALTIAETDPEWARRLHTIAGELGPYKALRTSRDKPEPGRLRALLLAGMTYRLINDHQRSRDYLEHLLRAAQRMQDPKKRAAAARTIRLAWIEQIRNDRDRGDFVRALRTLDDFRAFIAKDAADEFGPKLVAALLERTIYQAQAGQEVAENRPGNARRFARLAWEGLFQLSQEKPEYRDEVNAALYKLLGPDAAPAGLDPFEQCALLAGLLHRVDQAGGDGHVPGTPAAKTLDRAIAVAEHFLQHSADEAGQLVPIALYNLGVARYRRGQPARAVSHFMSVARHYRNDPNARPAATLAVEIAAERYTRSDAIVDGDARGQYVEALDLLLSRYSGSPSAEHWRFYYAQVLEELGRYVEAAAQYALVHLDHPHHLDSLFLRMRCLAESLQRQAARPTAQALLIRRSVADLVNLERAYSRSLDEVRSRATDPAELAALDRRLAQARVLHAETQVLPQIDNPSEALALLEDIEEARVGDAAVMGKVLRIRLLAYEKLGRLDEAAQTIPAYIEQDPQRAGSTLQSLYLSMSDAARSLREDGKNDEAAKKAEAALMLATHIDVWAQQNSRLVSPAQGLAVTRQLAQAHLDAGRYEEARDRFAAMLDGGREDDLPALLAHAEALYQLGEHAAALPEFNRIATSLAPDNPMRLKPLLRDLQCRTALDHPPAGILRVIEQARYFHSDLGGGELEDAFKKLRRQNQRRASSEPNRKR